MKRLALVLLTLGFVYAGCDDSSTSTPTDDTTTPTDTVDQDENVQPDGVEPTDEKPEPDVKEDVPDTEIPDEDVKDCVAICGDAECGEIDGCPCGDCIGGDVCEDNMCVCKPACDGKVCGADGCGGVCGECTGVDEVCSAGACVPALDCTTRTYDDTVAKINYLAIGDGGKPGEAMDVDEDPDTCAPADNCEGGLNNQLSGLLASLSSFVNVQEELDKALAGGDVLLLGEFVGDTTAPFTMNFYLGVAVAPVETCDYQTATCEYYVGAASLDPASCEPIITFPNATLTGGKLVAGGPDDKFSVSIPVQEGVIITVTAHMAQINGDVVLEPMSIDNGLIGGAIIKQEIMDAVDMLPPDVIAELPVGVDMIKNMLDTFIEPDIDTNADGEADAASIGIKFKAIAGTIVGLEPAE